MYASTFCAKLAYSQTFVSINHSNYRFSVLFTRVLAALELLQLLAFRCGASAAPDTRTLYYWPNQFTQPASEFHAD